MRLLAVIGLIMIANSGCGNEPCGHYPGDVRFQEMFGTNTESCYTSIGADLSVNITDGFTNFEMPYLKSIEGTLRIICNYDLKSFDLSSLVYVKGDVQIEGNKVLPDLDGLSGLSYIGGNLYIGGVHCKHANQELSDISGLSNVESVGADFTIRDNPKLPTCAAEGLLAQLKYFLGVASITGNDGSATCD
jgi:hypothetical protein